MAKKKLFSKVQSDLFNVNAANAGDLAGDTKFTKDQMAAIFGNLRTTGKGLAHRLSKAQAIELARMARLTRTNQAAINNIVQGGASGAGTLYGGQYGTTVKQAFGPAVAAGQAFKTTAKGLGTAGQLLATGQLSALNIQRQSTKEAKAGAAYAVTAAQSERAAQDAAAAAAAQLELDKLRLSHQLDLEKMAQDAKYNEAYLKQQARMANGGQAGGAGFASAAGLLQELLLSPDVSEGTIDSTIQSLASQYRLGPAAVARLREMAGAYSSDRPGGRVGNQYADSFSKEYGVSPSAYLSDTVEKALNQNVWKAYDPAKKLTMADALTIAGIKYGPDGKATSAGGQELSPENVAAAIAYVFSTWDRLAMGGVNPETLPDQAGGGNNR